MDEYDGSARIVIELDDSEIDDQASAAARRIEQRLQRGTRTTGRRLGRTIGSQLRQEIDRALVGITAEVNVTADTSGLRQSITGGLAGMSAQVDVTADTTGLRQSITGGLAGMSAQVDVTADAGRLRDSVDDALRRATSRFPAAVVAQPRVLRNSISAALERVTFQANVVARATTLRASINAAAADTEVSVRVVPDNARTFRALLQLGLDGLPPVRVRVEPDTSRMRGLSLPDGDTGGLLGVAGALRSVTAAAGGLAGVLARGVGLALLGAEAAAAAGGVVQLAAALAPAVGIIAAAPATIAGAGVAFGVLAAATYGVADAFESALVDDAAAFEDAIAGLAPAAQGVARELRGLRPELSSLQQLLQEAFFAQLTGDVAALGDVLSSGPLRTGLEDIASDFGQAASAALEFIASARGVELLESIIGSTRETTRQLHEAVTPVTQGLLEMAAAVQEAFGERLGAEITELGQRFGTFLSEAAASGQAVAWVSGAVTLFSQLRDVARDVATILGSVGEAIELAGGDALGVFAGVVDRVAQLAASEAGVTALAGAFRALNDIGAALGPVLEEVLRQLAGLDGGALVTGIEELAPGLRDLAVGIATGLQPILQVLPGLGTVLREGLGPVTDILMGLGSAIGHTARTLLPLVPLAGQLAAVLGTALTEGLRVAQAALEPLVDGLREAFTPETLGAATEGLAGFAEQLRPIAAELGGALAEALPVLAAGLADVAAALLPLGVQLLTILSDGLIDSVLPGLVDILPLVSDGLVLLAEAAGPIVDILGAQLLASLQELMPVITDELVPALLEGLLPALVGLLAAAEPLLPPLMELTTGFLMPALELLPPVIDFFTVFADTLTVMLDIAVALGAPLLSVITTLMSWGQMTLLVPLIEGVIGALTWLQTTVQGLLGPVQSVVEGIVGFFQWLFDVLIGNSIIPELILGIQTWFSGLPGRVLGVVSGLVQDIIGWFSRLPGRIYDETRRVGSQIASAISGGTSTVSAAVSGLIDSIVGWFRGLPGRIRDALSGIGGIIADAIPDGIDVIPGVPFLADGGIINRPTLGVMGEAGPEVVIPLTRPQRARQLIEAAGLAAVVAQAGRGSERPAPVRQQANTFNIYEAGDGDMTARRVVSRLVTAGGF